MRKNGISLIVLIVTIIVVIILAAVVILTLSKNNPIESAKEARFKEDVRTFQDELALYISKQYANAGGHWDGNISAKSYNEIVDYIPSFTKKYEGKFVINNNNIEYTDGLDEKEKEYAQKLNISEKKEIKLLPNEYQQVEYIESTGDQYIDTKCTVLKNCNVYLQLETSIYPSKECIFCGVWSNYRGFLFGYSTYKGNGFTIATTTEWQYPTNYIYPDNNKHIFEIKDDGAYIDNVKLSDVNSNLQEFKYNIFLFKANLFSPPGGNIKIYQYKYYNDKKELIRNLIPCYSIALVTDVEGKQCSSSTIGLYDTVERKFYTNQGTGEFIAGPDVNE